MTTLYAPTRYLKVALNEGRKPFFIRVTSESDAFFSGFEVDREGEEVQPKDADNRLHLIDKRAATFTEYRLSYHYGTLRKGT
jgi:hypothetical protein